MTRTLGLKGLDVSKYQTALPDLSGLTFIVLRSSIALTKDSKFTEHYANARKAGLVVMAYHYAYPASAAGIPEQVAFFLATAKDCDFLWLDQEEAGFDDAQAQQFINLVRDAGRACGLYHSASGFSGVNADAQWVADYRDASVVAGYPRRMSDGAELLGWDLWQWTSAGRLPGYVGNLDLNWMNPASRLAGLMREGWVTEAALDAAIDSVRSATAAALAAAQADSAAKTAQIIALGAALAQAEQAGYEALLRGVADERERIALAEAARVRAL